MKANTQNLLALWCHSAAIGLFERFSDQKNRGPNFSWDNFPSFVADYCSTNVFVNVTYPKVQQAEVELHAFNTGKELGMQLAKSAKLLTGEFKQ